MFVKTKYVQRNIILNNINIFPTLTFYMQI